MARAQRDTPPRSQLRGRNLNTIVPAVSMSNPKIAKAGSRLEVFRAISEHRKQQG